MFTEYDTNKTLTDDRSQGGLSYPGKMAVRQLLMNKFAWTVAHTDTDAAWLMQTMVNMGCTNGQMQTALFLS